MPTNSSDKQRATFVFKGTIQNLQNATMKQVPVDERTAVVTVDQVIEAPRNLAGLAGHKITVQLGGRQKPRPGQQFIFHTNGWIFGDSVAVQSVKQEEIKPTRAYAALLSRGGDPVMQKRDREAKTRFDSADMVVSGKVTAVRLPAETLRRSRAPAPARPVSEHSPHWREAVVNIEDVHKGAHAARSVVVRFPASTDVRWYKAPKFHPGQQGFFVLHKTELPKDVEPAGPAARAPARGKAAKPEVTEVFTALHPLDFQPYSEPGGVRAAIADKKP